MQKQNKGKMGQKKNKNAGKNDACHVTKLNKYLLENKSKWSAHRAYSKNEWDEEKITNIRIN